MKVGDKKPRCRHLSGKASRIATGETDYPAFVIAKPKRQLPLRNTPLNDRSMTGFVTG